MVGCLRTAELPAPITCDSLSRSTISTAGSVGTTGSDTASPVSIDTEAVPLPDSTVLMDELLESLLDGRVVLATLTLCKGERLRLDTRDESPLPYAALRVRPCDRVLLPRDSCPAAGACVADWDDTRGQSIEAGASLRPCSPSTFKACCCTGIV